MKSILLFFLATIPSFVLSQIEIEAGFELQDVQSKENYLTNSIETTSTILRRRLKISYIKPVFKELSAGIGIGATHLNCELPVNYTLEKFYTAVDIPQDYPDSIKNHQILDPNFSNNYLTVPIQVRFSQKITENFLIESSIIWDNEFQISSDFDIQKGRRINQGFNFACFFCSPEYEISDLPDESRKTLENFYRNKTAKILSSLGFNLGYKIDLKKIAFGNRIQYSKSLNSFAKELVSPGQSLSGSFFLQIKI